MCAFVTRDLCLLSQAHHILIREKERKKGERKEERQRERKGERERERERKRERENSLHQIYTTHPKQTWSTDVESDGSHVMLETCDSHLESERWRALL